MRKLILERLKKVPVPYVTALTLAFLWGLTLMFGADRTFLLVVAVLEAIGVPVLDGA